MLLQGRLAMPKCWLGGKVAATNGTLGLSMTPSMATQVLGVAGPEVLLSHMDQQWESHLASRKVQKESWCLGFPGPLMHPLLPSRTNSWGTWETWLGQLFLVYLKN